MGNAATPLGNMVIKLGLDDASFGKGVENSKKQIKYLAKEMQANVKIADLAGNSLGKLGTKYESLGKIVQAQEKQVNSLKKAYSESFVDGKATDSTKRLASELQNANGRLANYKQQMMDTAGAYAELQVRTTGYTGMLNDFSKAAESAGGKIQKLGAGVSAVGGTLTTGLTLPIAAGVAGVTKAAISWESAFAGVKKTNDEIIGSNGKVVYSYADLENGLRNLAKQLPSSHEQIAAVAEAAGQLGIHTDKVVDFTKVMVDMGESTNLSAETAATELARFANITQMSQDKFSNLGSAIVDLGNNFATTESEISAMSLRLAGAGAQVGMSEGDIVGLAAALSSVGIEAEAGGSAFSKVMVNMKLATENGIGAFDELVALGKPVGVTLKDISVAVQDGGKNLTNLSKKLGVNSKDLKAMYKEADTAAVSLIQFSDVAGMTNAEFADLFKSNSAEAIQKFIEGLAHAEDHGTSAIKVLDDMDITEVRLRDSLLRAANASGVFGDAIKKGNKAFKENSALTNEANKRYETTESKLKALKNEIKDAAIDLGGPFVDALRDTVKAGKPLVEGLGDMAKKFSSLSDEQKQNVLKWIGIAAAAGPALKLLGGGIDTVGKITTGVGKLSGSLVDLAANYAKKNAIKTVATDLSSAGGAALSASGSGGIGAFTGAIGGLGAALPVVVGAGGLLALGYGWWKAVGEEAWNAGERTKKYGTDIGAVTETSLKAVTDYSQKAVGQFGLINSGLSENTQPMIDNFQKMGTAMQEFLVNRIDSLKKALDLLPESAKASVSEFVEAEIKKAEDAEKIVSQNNEKIAAIRKRGSDSLRDLTIAETQQIKEIMTQSAEQYLNITIDDSKKRKEVLESMTADVDTATKEQATTMLQNLAKSRYDIQQQGNEELKGYRKNLEEWGILNTEAGQKMYQAFEDSQKSSTDAMDAQIKMLSEKYPELLSVVDLSMGMLIQKDAQGTEYIADNNQRILDNMKARTAVVKSQTEEQVKALDLMGDATTDAGYMWNSLVFDPKTGEVKTNAGETVAEAIKEDKNWNLLFNAAKFAKLSSNAKEVLADATIQNGRWDSLTFTEKEMLLESNASYEIMQALEVKGDWEKLTFEQKQALVYSNTPEVMAENLAQFGLWDKYAPMVKELNADNYNFLYTLSVSEGALDAYNALSPLSKDLVGTNPVNIKISEAQSLLKDYNALPPKQKELLGSNAQVSQVIGRAEEIIRNYNLQKVYTKNIGIDNSENWKIADTQSQLNALRDKSVRIKVQQIMENRDRGYAKGTNYHPGGAMIVNDESQFGRIKKELVIRPNGQMFIPQGRNVYLNEPAGTKVVTASRTKTIMNRMGIPHYAEGVDIPENSRMVQNLRSVNFSEPSSTTTINMTGVETKLAQLIVIMSKFGADLKNLKLMVDEKQLGKVVTENQDEQALIKALLSGEGFNR